jgi:hypothetical protein
MMHESLTVRDDARAALRKPRRPEPHHGEAVGSAVSAINAAQLLALQRSAGNRATSVAIANTLSLQRDCGCGGACSSCGPETGESDYEGGQPDNVQRAVGDQDSTADSSDPLSEAASIARQ